VQVSAQSSITSQQVGGGWWLRGGNDQLPHPIRLLWRGGLFFCSSAKSSKSTAADDLNSSGLTLH